MRFYRMSSVLMAIADISGGLLLTMLSGLHAVKPLVMDAEMIYYGFPFAWLEAVRGGKLFIRPWIYHFAWQNFVVDFVIFGLLVSGVVYLYFTKRAFRKE